MDVRSFKLIGGQTVIAELINETGLGYLVKNPLAVHVLKGPDGEGHLAFAQWSMIEDPTQPIEIYDHGLLNKPIPAIPEVAHSYAEQVTGLSLPPPSASRILHG